jgi:hypothetical protein
MKSIFPPSLSGLKDALLKSQEEQCLPILSKYSLHIFADQSPPIVTCLLALHRLIRRNFFGSIEILIELAGVYATLFSEVYQMLPHFGKENTFSLQKQVLKTYIHTTPADSLKLAKVKGA